MGPGRHVPVPSHGAMRAVGPSSRIDLRRRYPVCANLGSRLTVFSTQADGRRPLVEDSQDRSIDTDSRRNRANRGSLKFVFEINSANF